MTQIECHSSDIFNDCYPLSGFSIIWNLSVAQLCTYFFQTSEIYKYGKEDQGSFQLVLNSWFGHYHFSLCVWLLTPAQYIKEQQ
jgi:hypothetical protein